MALEDGGLSVLDMSLMGEVNDLCDKILGISEGVVLGGVCDASSFDIFDGQVLDIETNFFI